MDEAPLHRMYDDLASWWPLISSPDDYAEEAAFAASLLASAKISVRDVLELGSGGGNNASHLKARFAMTLVDRSPSMLDVSTRLNPECEHVLGDMRAVRLGRAFDAVFVHDAIGYMVNEDDLRAAIETAFAHCRPGGVAVLVPDETRETFTADTSHGGHDGADGRAVRYLEWSWDPDPADTTTRTEYVIVLRETDGATRVVHDAHETGLFGRDDWLAYLAAAGFDAEAVTEITSEDRAPREFFVARRPSD